MSKSDPGRERSSALRRSRVARQGLVLGAVAGSVGIAGALGLSAATNQTSPAPRATDYTYQGNQDDGVTLSHVRILQPGDDREGRHASGDDREGRHASDDDGRVWIPAPPSPQFSTGGQGGQTGGGQTSGGQTSGGSTGGGGGGGGQSAPHATTGGS